MKYLAYILLSVCCLLSSEMLAQQCSIGGVVVDAESGQPVEYASILIAESGQWAITDAKGAFTIKSVAKGRATVSVQCLGYEKRTWPFTLTGDMLTLKLRISAQSLKLSEVTITAKRKQDEATTSYSISSQALEQQQILNIADIETLLPGGKTVNPSLLNDNRMSLRSGSQEQGNASFGTAIEVDGQRLDNNASLGTAVGASTRTLSTANIESVEIVTGIASVEHGDLSNGIVKVNTRKGRSPYTADIRLNQHTRQVALSKGFDLGEKAGVLNATLEHARSFSDAASPYTAYQRNIVALNYHNTLFRDAKPLSINLGLNGNVGGYNSKADPDLMLGDYSKSRDNVVRINLSADWLTNLRWLTNISLSASASLSDRYSEDYYHTSSASTQPYLHATSTGYNIAQQVDADAFPLPAIVLGPTGYWYVTARNAQRPASWQAKLKGDLSRHIGQIINRGMIGIEYKGSKNYGRGTYYDDARYAPTWREYRYDRLPAMHNVALFAEDKISMPTNHRGSVELTAGLRSDITAIGGSDYGTVASLSPRGNARYVVWRQQRKRFVSDLQVHAGWGKSVKLPSFQVLYPSPSYADRLSFASTSTTDNTSFYAYHTFASAAVYNPSLRWQHTTQTDLGIELTARGHRLSLSAYHHRTSRSYMSIDHFTPMSYLYTPPSALNSVAIPADDRQFDIDAATGVVTVSDRNGLLPSQTLEGKTEKTFAVTHQFVNASPVDRYGLEWIVDFAQIKPLSTQLRIDGNFYIYKGLDDRLFADIPMGLVTRMTNGDLYQYVGYYRGTNATGTGYSANASVSNGSLTRSLNLNGTLTTHIPRLRMVMALRIESTLLTYRRNLCKLPDGTPRGYASDKRGQYVGTPYDGSTENQYVMVYPDYYTTWDDPTTLIPFADKFLWAKDHDRQLYNDLARLVVTSNYPYVMNPNTLSAYYSANFTLTKEIGDHVSLSFYANNFFNNMKKVHSSQTGLDTSLFASGYIPSFYFGLAMKVKIN